MHATPSRSQNYHLYKFKTPRSRCISSGPQGLNVQRKVLIFVFKDNNYSNGLLHPTYPLIRPLLPPQTTASCCRYVFQSGGTDYCRRLYCAGPAHRDAQLTGAMRLALDTRIGQDSNREPESLTRPRMFLSHALLDTVWSPILSVSCRKLHVSWTPLRRDRYRCILGWL